MTPEEFAERHPRLFHVTEPGAHSLIRMHGLLSSKAILDLFEVGDAHRNDLLLNRRSEAVPLDHKVHGEIILNDQLPLSMKALESCLDDGLKPTDWLDTLNSKVFLWPDEKTLARLLGARMNRSRTREVIVFDGLGVAKACWDRLYLSPINSGATIRKPARRGLSTFTRASDYSYSEWRKLRGRYDSVVEIGIDYALENAGDLIVDTYVHMPQSA